MDKPRGRAASAKIVQRLRDALASGRAKTYEELARDARCTARTVRNYLPLAETVLGTRIEKVRGPDRTVRVRAAVDEGATNIEELAAVLAREMLKNLFPIEGTALDVKKKSPVQVVIATRGAYEYGEDHLRALRAWILAAGKRPRRALRFVYEGMASGKAPRIVWPIGIVVRDSARVYLAGVPEDAAGPHEVKTYCLERVEQRSPAFEILSGPDAAKPPPGIDEAVIENAIDLPFSMFPARAESQVHVKARFGPEQARHVLGRRWHRSQRIKMLKDGGVELRFGPADRTEAASWVRSWGPSLTLLGDERLIAYLAK